MRYLKKTSLILLILLSVSCTKIQTITFLPNDIIRLVADANKEICSYKGGVVVRYADSKEDVRFKAMLDKTCSGDFLMKVLAPFGRVVFEVSFIEGELKAYEKGEDVSGKIGWFVYSNGVDRLMSGLKVPELLPDSTFKASVIGDSYLFTKGKVRIEADKNYKITKVSGNGISYMYEYNEEKLVKINYEDSERVFEMGLKN